MTFSAGALFGFGQRTLTAAARATLIRELRGKVQTGSDVVVVPPDAAAHAGPKKASSPNA